MNRSYSCSSSSALQECFLQLQQAQQEAQQCLKSSFPQLPMSCIRPVKNSELLLERIAQILEVEVPPLLGQVSGLEKELQEAKSKLIQLESQNSRRKVIVRGREGFHAEMNGVYVEVGLHRNQPIYSNSYSGWVIYITRSKHWVFDWRGLVNGDTRDDGEYEAISAKTCNCPTEVALWKVFDESLWVADVAVDVSFYEKKTKSPPASLLLAGSSEQSLSYPEDSSDSLSFIKWDSFYSSSKRKLFPEIFPSNIHPLFNAKIPIPEVEQIIDDYVSSNARLFPFKGLYLSAMGEPMYRTLSLRLVHQGQVMNMTKFMGFHGQEVEYGPSKLSACQYVTGSQKAEIFHAEKPPPIAQLFGHSDMVSSLTKDFKEVQQAAMNGEKRGVWKDVQESLTNPNFAFNSDSLKLATMFETYTCLQTSYVGAPVKNKSGATIAVICLLHHNPIETADQWIAQSKIEELCDTVGRKLQTYNFDHNYTSRNLFQGM